MNKKISLGAAITFVVLAIAVTASITSVIVLHSFDSLMYDINDKENVYEKLSEIEHIVDKHYYGEVDDQTLQDAVADGYMKGLQDPYSVYLSAKEYEDKKLSNSGMRVGIGVTLLMDESGYAKVVQVAKDTPAELAGIKVNDLIVALDGESVLQKSLAEIVDLVSGEENTELTLTVRRDTENKDFKVTRQSFDLETVTYQMLDDIGYINIAGFNDKTTAQFTNALESVQKDGAVGLVFDLRGNGGGLLDAANECLDMLVGKGNIITANYANGESKVLYESDASEINLPMVVLQNGNTASAAELFSATLRDFGKASIVGTKSYGKGVMQTLYELEDGSAVNVTTAQFVPMSGNSFHKVGIAPTYEVTLTKEQEQMVLLGDHSDDLQLNKALEVLTVEK